jgi:hypothetical protein
MGAFYVNSTVNGSDQKAVVRALSGRKAFVTAERNGYIVVFGKESDAQTHEAIAKLAAQFSAILQSTLLTVLIRPAAYLCRVPSGPCGLRMHRASVASDLRPHHDGNRPCLPCA